MNNTFMGFDPGQVNTFKSMFERPQTKKKEDPDIYTTNPSDSISEDGHYRSKVRILFNPFDPEHSLVNQVTYYLSSLEGSRLVRSKSANGDRDCPIVNAFMGLWRNPDKKDWARSKFDRTERKWVLVQVLEDENKPELKGRLMLYKLAKDIVVKMQMLMSPSEGAKGKQPYPVMDYLVGLELDIDVTPGPDDAKNPGRKQREISYGLSQFGEYAPIIRTDGSPLFSEPELELIDNYVSAATDFRTGKTETKRQAGQKALVELRPQISPLYTKALEYLKENAKSQAEPGQSLDVQQRCSYQPWDPETTDFVNMWIDRVKAGVDPMITSYELFASHQSMPAQQTQKVPQEAPSQGVSMTAPPAFETDPNIPF